MNRRLPAHRPIFYGPCQLVLVFIPILISPSTFHPTWLHPVPLHFLSIMRATSNRPRAAFTLTPVRASVGVAGATGGVGRLLVRKLCATGVPVRALVRDSQRARVALPPATEIAETGSLISPDGLPLARRALEGVHALYICVGTTAFPTRRWLRGDTPKAVDVAGVERLLRAADLSTLRRVVLLSSIGTGRTHTFPFSILNSFGVLDAKRNAETLVRDTARARGFSFAIVRPGRLVGAPHTNIGMLRVDHDARMADVALYPGDKGAGNCSRSVTADVMLAAGAASCNLDFSVIEKEGEPVLAAELRRRVRRMRADSDLLVADELVAY